MNISKIPFQFMYTDRLFLIFGGRLLCSKVFGNVNFLFVLFGNVNLFVPWPKKGKQNYQVFVISSGTNKETISLI